MFWPVNEEVCNLLLYSFIYINQKLNSKLDIGVQMRHHLQQNKYLFEDAAALF